MGNKERTIAVLDDMGVDKSKTVVDHSTEETTKMILDAGYWAGHTVYPETKLTKERFANIFFEFGVERMTVNSSGDWGKSDPMAVVKTAAHIERLGGDPAQIQKLVWDNPVAFYGKERLALPEGEEKVFA